MKIIRNQAIRKLRHHNVSQPQNSMRILFQQCFQNEQYSFPQKIAKFNKLIHLRSHHFPVQYLCRSWQFRQLNIRLQRPILIPRFQTEYMVTLLIQKINKKYSKQTIDNNQLTFVQYGCGSGVIGLSINKELSLPGIMIDIEPKCIYLSQYNARINQCNLAQLEIIQADMQLKLSLIKQVDIVISNPPYLSESHYKKNVKWQVRKFEDKKALVGGDNGMKYIRMLIGQWKKRGNPGIMFIEYDGRVFEGEDQWLNQFIIKDQYQKNRYLMLEK